MKIATQESDIEISPHLKTSQFQIAQTAHTFQLLSKGIYSMPVRAVIRELCCNALDSHRVHGNPDTPFDLHLPTDLERTFKVRDYGTGLSHEDVEGLYSTYMASSKQGSNDQTGCFGLGSKSPFAVTRTFTVTSWHGGKKMVFVATIADTGLPSLTHLMTKPCDEPTGLEVSFQPNDMSTTPTYTSGLYRAEAGRVLRAFDVLPNTNITIECPTPDEDHPMVLEGPNFKLYYVRWGIKDSVLTMGNVDYPDRLKDFRTQFPWLKEHMVHLECPIGTFTPTPSRESISWSDHSQEGVLMQLRKVDTAIAVECQKAIDAAECRFDALRIHHGFLSLKPKGLTWRGQDLDACRDQVGLYKVKLPDLKDSSGNICSTDQYATHRELYPTTRVRDKKSQVQCSSLNSSSANPSTQHIPAFVYPRGKSVARRLMHHVREEEERIFLISAVVPLDEVPEVFGIPEDRIRFSDDYPLPPAKPRAPVEREKFTAALLGGCLTATEVDISKGGIYAPLRYSKLKMTSWTGDEFSADYKAVDRAYRQLERFLGVKHTPVIASRVKLSKKLAELPNWKPIEEHIRDLISENVPKMKKWALPAPSSGLEPMKAKAMIEMHAENQDDLFSNELVDLLKEESSHDHHAYEQANPHHIDFHLLGFSFIKSPEKTIPAHTEVEKEYPMLAEFAGWAYTDRGTRKNLVHYIKLVNESKNR